VPAGLPGRAALLGEAIATGSARSSAGHRAVKTVLLVCQANTCRSVMAQALLEAMLAPGSAARRVRVRSAGIGHHARDGMIPSLDARIVLREEGIRLDEATITSTALRRHLELLDEADVVVTMTAAQKAMLDDLHRAGGQTRLTLKELAGETGDVADPFGQEEAAYRACRDEIKRCLTQGLGRLLAALES
jgi:protein arginine phosphatase